MACRDVSALQNTIRGIVGMNCMRISSDLEQQFGEYGRRVQNEQALLEEEKRLHRARTDKTAVLLSEAYVDKQKRLQRDHNTRRQQRDQRKVSFAQDF